MRPAKQRLDQLLVDRGLADSRQKAQALILAGSVIVGNQKAAKAGQPVPLDTAVEVVAPMPYVSRGGLKLERALDHWAIDPAGRVCIDIGASTGGFTDCLLQRGAARVYAVDAGTAQLDWKLRNEPRVVVLEQYNARHLQPADIADACSIAVFDVSFISVTLILPAVMPVLTADAHMLILVKPQFEVGREQVGKGGIVRDPALHQAACDKVAQAVAALGLRSDIIESPILGAEGNREFLLHASH